MGPSSSEDRQGSGVASIGKLSSLRGGGLEHAASAGERSQQRVSDEPGKGDSLFHPSRSTIVLGTSRRLTGSAMTTPRGTRGRIAHQERDVNLGLVQARAMAKLAVLAELFPVIGRDDQQRAVELTPPAQFTDQLTQRMVQRRDAVVVRIPRKRYGLGIG